MTHVFTTQRLCLRRLERGDAPAIAAILNDPEMCYGLTLVPCPYTVDDAVWFIDEASQDALAVCTRDDRLVGSMGLGKQLGYWIDKQHWGKGFATEAATPILADHFSRSDADVISGYVDDNHGSAKVLKKLGFVVTGKKMLPIRSRGIEVPATVVTLSKAQWEAAA